MGYVLGFITNQPTKELHGAESFLRNLTVIQLLKKFLTLYGTRRFITVFITACHWSPS
jgi:hypothetical protein